MLGSLDVQLVKNLFSFHEDLRCMYGLDFKNSV
jgi:hypothetical protein